MHNKELEWGQTPFDECSREELIQHCARMYSATSALWGVASQLRDDSLFWTQGVGGEAIEKGRQALESARNGFDDDDFYRAYLRYAVDLLFVDAPGLDVRACWAVCPVCEHVTSSYGVASNVGRICNEVMPGTCSGVLRELAWDDIKPKNAQKQADV